MGLLTGLIQAEIIAELLPIIESFDRGLTFWSGESEEKKGMSLIFQKFEDALQKIGLETITPKIGDHFDPAAEECVAVVETGPPGAVAEILEKGYIFKKRVIKPAKVKVVKQ